MFTKIFVSAFLIFCFLLTQACPVKKADLETMQKRSRQIATASNAGVNLTRTLYREKIISLGLKDDIADGFINLAEGGMFADQKLAKAIANYGAKPPANVKQQLVALFRSNILDRFLDVLKKLKVVETGDRYRQILEAVKTAVLVMANFLEIGGETEAAIQEVM